MGREFLSIRALGSPFHTVKEAMFLLCAADRRQQKSAWPKILIFLNGKCRISLRNGWDETAEAGDIFILPYSCRHNYASVSEAEDSRVYTFGLFFTKTESRRAGGSPEIRSLLEKVLDQPRLLRGGADLEIRHLISDFRREADERLTGYRLRMRLLMLSLLVAIARRLEQRQESTARPPHTSTHLIQETKEFMSKAMATRLTLGKIAWHVKLSEEHLARIFRKETGMTVMDYLRYLRIDAAKIYLLNSNDTVEVLAHRLGFGSVNPFCRAFKESTGQTPTEYRTSHIGKHPEKA